MKIDRNTKYKDFAPFAACLAEGEDVRLQKAAVEDKFGSDGFMAMTLGDMLAAMRGDTSPLLNDKGATVFDVFRLKAFKGFVDELIAVLRSTSMPPTAEDGALRTGMLDSTFEESVYVFCRGYFGLRSFGEVDTLKVADYILARRDDYNRAVVDRNMAAAIKKGGKR